MGQVSQLLQDTISRNFHRPPHLLAKEKVDFIKKYSALAMERKTEELKLRFQMSDHIETSMTGKCLALWRRMLNDLNHPDTWLIDDVWHGFPLSGGLPTSGVFPAWCWTAYAGSGGLKLYWTGCFDDFSTLSRPELQNNTAWAVDSLIALLV